MARRPAVLPNGVIMATTRYEIHIMRNQSLEQLKDVVAYEVLDYQASTYHKFTFSDGSELMVNDFGVSAIKKRKIN